ncbi:MAG: hypothetical protein AB8G17_21905 [Gammaproteobacteria bacterium]
MKLTTTLAAISGTALLLGGVHAHAQSLMLDDNPQAPLLGFTGFGTGAESPWGFPVAPGAPTAPSPVLPLIPGIVVGDGDIIGPGPIAIGAPGLPYIASLSDSANAGVNGFVYSLYFSADRVTQGAVGTAVNVQNGLNQQAADVFRGASTFVAPASIIGTMNALPAPFAGILPTVIAPVPLNVLVSDESVFGLPADASGAVIGPGVVAGPPGRGIHNNLDGFDFSTVATAGVFGAQTYQTAYPDETFPFGVPTADVFDIAPGTTTFCGFPAFAPSAAMGLIFGDVIDAMVVFDNGPMGSAACGGVGAQRGRDGILFSLAPGSPSLGLTGRSPGDIFLSDFSGNFGVYASAANLGLLTNAGGSPAASGDNVDALEMGCLGDLNRDGAVNVLDVTAFNICSAGGPACGDFNADGVTNFQDLIILAGNFGCTGG